MKFVMSHNNINVHDLKESVEFYKTALNMCVVEERIAEDGSFILNFLEDGESAHRLELTWLRDHTESYDLGENEIHLAFDTDDYEAAHALHESMGIICYENPKMGIYFIADPDGYWIEIVPWKRRRPSDANA